MPAVMTTAANVSVAFPLRGRRSEGLTHVKNVDSKLDRPRTLEATQ